MTAKAFEVSVQLFNHCVPGRWLCLDGILDGALMLDDIPEEDRILPLSAHDGTHIIAPGQAAFDAVKSGSAVYMASAAMFDTMIVIPHTFIQGISREFYQGKIPLLTEKGKLVRKVDPKRNSTQNVLTRRLTVTPCLARWVGHGEIDDVMTLMDRLNGIGAKTAMGYGVVRSISVKEVPCEGVSGIIDPDSGDLTRPVPKGFLEKLGKPAGNSRLRIETCRPPYFDAKKQTVAHVPVGRSIDGIL